MQHDGGGSHGLLNVVIQDTALKGRAKRPFLICVTAVGPPRTSRITTSSTGQRWRTTRPHRSARIAALAQDIAVGVQR